MSDTWSVKFEGVTKRYRRGGQSQHTMLRSDIARLASRLRGRTPHESSENYMTALDDVDFEIERGYTYALVGRNGAGKTTALRLISRITYPSVGRIRVRGRVGALIEIGAGIHPELSGRENIWLYGSFLGLRRDEIRRAFDDIIAFAELEQHIDSPVKFYSTGMYLRLGFAVASFLGPELFVVDESLAVADGAFQARCIGRMKEMAAQGSTIIFVSHETSAVHALCQRGIWLDAGSVRAQGEIDDVLQNYNRSLANAAPPSTTSNKWPEPLEPTLLGHDGQPATTISNSEPISARISLRVHRPMRSPRVLLRTGDEVTDLVEIWSTTDLGAPPPGNVWSITCELDRLPLRPNLYRLSCSVVDSESSDRLLDWTDIASFQIIGGPRDRRGGDLGKSTGPVSVDARWTADSFA